MNRPRTDLSSWVINDVRAGVKFHRQLGKPKVQLYTCNLNLVLYGAAGLRLHLVLAVFQSQLSNGLVVEPSSNVSSEYQLNRIGNGPSMDR